MSFEHPELLRFEVTDPKGFYDYCQKHDIPFRLNGENGFVAAENLTQLAFLEGIFPYINPDPVPKTQVEEKKPSVLGKLKSLTEKLKGDSESRGKVPKQKTVRKGEAAL